MAGRIKLDGNVAAKAGLLVMPDGRVEVAEAPKYVSRGGDKLASVADELRLEFAGKTVLDVGASTGGFTDFALQNGATKVIAVDVGTGQMDWRLRQDDRVEIHEQTDVRAFESDQKVDIAMIDVSFISILKIIDTVAMCVKPNGQIVAMIKPQFEAGKPLADKSAGVISDPKMRAEIIERVKLELGSKFDIVASADSAVLGPKGNQEHFVVLVA